MLTLRQSLMLVPQAELERDPRECRPRGRLPPLRSSYVLAPGLASPLRLWDQKENPTLGPRLSCSLKGPWFQGPTLVAESACAPHASCVSMGVCA